ncbi:P-loop containing nucleoside triphosphate hydrolase protein [Endogone sp. FLAS-F59071]|nr:P-loop containing nucleoside triphosphate hydrolase protein [Endogone sp. FLAS-F59071]|eukprot:RUS23245.1 P-loop containing nucleoside triphosphate hydrolase protein [Endogone sp. FLAS-F59071]
MKHINRPAIPTLNSESSPSSSTEREVTVAQPSQRASIQATIKSIFKAPSLEFPGAARCEAAKTNKPMRMMQIPVRFNTPSQYKDTFSQLIYEHLQVLLINVATRYRTILAKRPHSANIEEYFRRRGIGFYSSCSLGAESRSDSWQAKSHCKGPQAPAVEPTFFLRLSDKEHHSVYSKDDIWIVSKSIDFEPASTFLGRSVFYGPSSGGSLEFKCVNPKNTRTAREIAAEKTPVYAIRSVAANAEFMMLVIIGLLMIYLQTWLICADNLAYFLHETPLLPSIINHIPTNRSLSVKQAGFKPPSRVPNKSGCLVLKEAHGVDVEAMIKDVAREFTLNEDQESALRTLAGSVIVAPGWSDGPSQVAPILVHGVFGAGKSYLIAVMIIFLQRITAIVMDDNKGGEGTKGDENGYRILVTSMTNVAVDRILMTLLELGFMEFVRVGSLKKIAKPILPFTAQIRPGAHEELKELESMLEGDSLSEEETKYVQDAVRRFKQSENKDLVARSPIVGTTCMASVFDIFNDIRFPLVILDESSQIAEPMAMVPVSRLGAERLLLVGDPLQLPPMLATSSDSASVGKGLDKTLFDRMMQMGVKPVMLRTQYRLGFYSLQCHPRISAISNILFYEKRLVDGITLQDRAPLVVGLPTLCYIDVQGQEQQNPQSNSYSNEAEINIAVATVRRLLELGVQASDMGVIALYKDQANKIDGALRGPAANNKKKDGVQISTVDAFQGAEKDVIILSCVRTTRTNFIDTPQRVNVALTRAKRCGFNIVENCRHLVLLGHRKMLEANALWNRILAQCKDSQDEFTDAHTFIHHLNELEIAANVKNQSKDNTSVRYMPRADVIERKPSRSLPKSLESIQGVNVDDDDFEGETKKINPTLHGVNPVQSINRGTAKRSLKHSCTAMKENITPRDETRISKAPITTSTTGESRWDHIFDLDIEDGLSPAIAASARELNEPPQQKDFNESLKLTLELPEENDASAGNKGAVLRETSNVASGNPLSEPSNSTEAPSINQSFAPMTEAMPTSRSPVSILEVLKLRAGATSGLVDKGVALPPPCKLLREIGKEVDQVAGENDEDDVGCLEF